ncbi:hypothetical protein DSM106972_089660 [Dulcicalothrix desertica PCC 7102]|uniref:HTH cro/C1-type domain-containing protein n=2 Tax=Dulcicalothrix desertica TaxID=32056 RepID=A0A433UP49_9CYAN|nr:hypothetical protein DSM106972_089660 [Dulcicalothrix desertica PCC 7102]
MGQQKLRDAKKAQRSNIHGTLKRLTYEKLAEKANVSLSTVKRLFKGETLLTEYAEAITDALGVNLQDVIVEESANVDFPYDVERPSLESYCYEALFDSGSLVRIKAPHGMGKTSLIQKVICKFQNHDYTTVIISFNDAEQEDFYSLENFLRWLCLIIGNELNLQNRLDELWDCKNSNKINCTSYFQDYLLNSVKNQLILCMDDMDLVFQNLEEYEDFCGLLRSWYNKMQIRSAWKKLKLVVIHSTEVYMIKDINQSPFNVGISIEIPELSLQELISLDNLYQLDLEVYQIKQFMDIIGGHPELVKQAFVKLKHDQNISFSSILEYAHTEQGIYRNHLRQHLLNLKKQPELLQAFKNIVMTNSSVCLEDEVKYKLLSTGLVVLDGNNLKIRCKLYSEYFRNKLGNANE